jgi:hypothetical protein
MGLGYCPWGGHARSVGRDKDGGVELFLPQNAQLVSWSIAHFS